MLLYHPRALPVPLSRNNAHHGGFDQIEDFVNGSLGKARQGRDQRNCFLVQSVRGCEVHESGNFGIVQH
jgi:hypothetical protein